MWKKFSSTCGHLHFSLSDNSMMAKIWQVAASASCALREGELSASSWLAARGLCQAGPHPAGPKQGRWRRPGGEARFSQESEHQGSWQWGRAQRLSQLSHQNQAQWSPDRSIWWRSEGCPGNQPPGLDPARWGPWPGTGNRVAALRQAQGWAAV